MQIQQEIFKEPPLLVDMVVKDLIDVKKELENVRKGLFRRYQDLRNENDGLKEDLKIIKKYLKLEDYESKAEVFVFSAGEPTG